MPHPLHSRSRWCHPTRGLRVQALKRDMYTCQSCGRTEASHRLHAHHIVPHKGDPVLFFDINNIRTLCEDCHSTEAHQIEAFGYSLELDRDGLPIDPRHPFNR
jgi:5-methylcytosine-specific restriction endonuclease McrA